MGNNILDNEDRKYYYMITKVCKDSSCVHSFGGYCLYPHRPKCNYEVASNYRTDSKNEKKEDSDGLQKN